VCTYCVCLQADEVYVKVRASLDRLMREADRIDMKIPLNPEKLRKMLKTGRSDGEEVSAARGLEGGR
jgi:hypothetical protein